MIDDRLSEELNALVDGELAEERATELRARLESDGELRAEFDRLRRVADLVKALPPARANLVEDVMASLPPRGHVLRPWAWLGGLAAAAAAVIVSVALWEREPPPPTGWTEAKGPRPAERDAEEPKAEASKAEEPKAKEEAKEEALVARLEETNRAAPERKLGAKGARESARDRGAAVPAGVDKEEADDAASVPATIRKEPSERDLPPPQPGGPAGFAAGTSEIDLLARVEKKGVHLTPAERDLYLKRIGKLDNEALAAHLARVGAGRTLSQRPAKTKARAARAGCDFDVVASDAAEAAAVRLALARAFRTEGAAAKKVGPSAVQAEARDATGGVLQYDWQATPEQAGSLATWLERIGLLAPARGGVEPGRVNITGEFAEKAKDAAALPVRVRIRYRATTAADPRSDDK
jgi:hypothetical protein